MLQDDSNEHEATWEFLERRIDNVSEMGRLLRQNSNLASAMQTGLQSIFSIVRPPSGGNSAGFDDSEMLRR